MTTLTDAEWEAIEAAFPANFLSIQSDKFSAAKNWLNTIFDRIGLACYNNVNVFNHTPFAKYNRGVLNAGDTMQAYRTKVITLSAYDSDYTINPFKVIKNPPIAQYDTINVEKNYQLSMTSEQIIKTFTSKQMLGDFIATQIEALSERDVIDQYTEWKKYVSNEDIFAVVDTGKDVYKTIRDYVMDFHMPSSKYNKAGDEVISDTVDVILTREKFIEVEDKLGMHLSGCITLGNTNIRWIDNFTTPVGAKDKVIDGIIVDSRALNRWVKPPRTWSTQNPIANVFDYGCSFESILGVDKFRNAVMLVSNAS